MPDYRRSRVPGGCYLFTVNLLGRYPNDRLTRQIEGLRAVVRKVRRVRLFHIDGWVVLPDREWRSAIRERRDGNDGIGNTPCGMRRIMLPTWVTPTSIR
jgi:putative transposase